MAITTYGDLKQNVQLWLNRNDSATVAAIPTFINFAEQDFQRTMKLPQYENTLEIIVPSAGATVKDGLTLPIDYYEIKHLFVNDKSYSRVDVDTYRRIIKKQSEDASASASRDAIEQRATVNRPMHIFCRIGNNILVYPNLVDKDTIKMIYWKQYPVMSNDSDTTDTLAIAPDIMLYLSLRHAAVFLRDNDQAQFWTQKAEEAGTRLLMKLDTIEWSGSPITVPDMGLNNE